MASNGNEAAAGSDSARSTGLRRARGAFHGALHVRRKHSCSRGLRRCCGVGRGDDDLRRERGACTRSLDRIRRRARRRHRAGSGAGFFWSREETMRWPAATTGTVAERARPIVHSIRAAPAVPVKLEQSVSRLMSDGGTSEAAPPSGVG
jgi:hypothetical protein